MLEKLTDIPGLTIGAFIGAGLTYITTKLLDHGRRKNEAEDISSSLYSEIAERTARCLHDSENPWNNFDKSRIKWDVARVERFRPANPVVYPGIASKIGLIKKDALFLVINFYFFLDAVRREIDSVAAAFDRQDNILEKDKTRLAVVRHRLCETFKPALKALEQLDVAARSEPTSQLRMLTKICARKKARYGLFFEMHHRPKLGRLALPHLKEKTAAGA